MRLPRFLSLVCLPLLCAGILSGCAASSGGGNTEPVNMSQFKSSTTRFDVISAVGEPSGRVTYSNRTCDIYHLYTSGLSAGGKAGLKAAEIMTSIVSLGVAEIGWATAEAGSRPNIHTVLFCYVPQSDRLVEIHDKNPTNGRKPRISIISPDLYSAPINAADISKNTSVTSAPATLDSSISPTPKSTTVETPDSQTQTIPNTPAAAVSGNPAETPAMPMIPAGIKVDHITTDPTTGQQTIYEQRATPENSAPAGSIGLNNVSREAINGTSTVKTKPVTIPANASADDLNDLSSSQSEAANKAALHSGQIATH